MGIDPETDFLCDLQAIIERMGELEKQEWKFILLARIFGFLDFYFTLVLFTLYLFGSVERQVLHYNIS